MAKAVGSSKAAREGVETLFEPDVKALLSAHGVDVPRGSVAHSTADLAGAASDLRAPLVLKAFGPRIVHKSDVGAVKLGLTGPELPGAAEEMMERLRRRGLVPTGFLVEEQERTGLELLVGVVRRPPFGPMVALGLGGTMTELLDDVALRLYPLARDDAEKLVRSGRIGRLMAGVRGGPALGHEALVDLLMALAGPCGAAAELGEALTALECNPVLVTPQRAVALDARVLLGPEPQGPSSGVAPGSDLTPLFHPRGVAVAGASTTRSGFGNRALAAYRSMGWGEGLYAVHPTAAEIDSVPAVRSIADVDGPVDYCLVTVPAQRCAGVVRQTAGLVPFVHVVSGGFAEEGTEGRELEEGLLAAAQEVGARLVGPNCIGMYCPEGRQTFQLDAPRTPGTVGIVSQSGGLAGDLIKAGAVRGIRFSSVATVGNARDVTPGEVFDWLVEDPKTLVIGIYLEGSADAARVTEALRRASGRIPVALLVGGQTPAGVAAVASHTGSLAGDLRIWRAVTEATGACLVTRFEELLAVLAYAQRWAGRSVPAGAGTVVVGVGGGASVLAADACGRAGTTLVATGPEAGGALKEMGFGVGTSARNPVEIPFGPVTPVDTLHQVLEAVLPVQPYEDVLVHVNVQAYYSYGTEGVRPLVAQLASLASGSWPSRLGVVARNLECAPAHDAETLRGAMRDLELPLFGDFDEAGVAIAALQRFCAAARQPR